MVNEKLITELEMIAHLGAKQASEVLSTFINRKVVISVLDVASESISQIPEKNSNSEELSVGILARVLGDIEGNAVLIFEKNNARKLITLLGGAEQDDTEARFTKIERSMLEETANITISSFMNCMSSHLNKTTYPNAPVLLVDMAGAIFSVMLLENAAVSDEAIIFSTEFTCQDEKLKALFAFLPNPKSLTVIQNSLPI